MKVALVLCLAAYVAADLARASIEPTPVPVHAGPMYMLSSPEKDAENVVPTGGEQRPAPIEPSPASPAAASEPSGESDEEPMGRVHIRRVILFPIMRPFGRPSPADELPSDESRSFLRQLIMPDAYPTSARHLFGQDEASRSPFDSALAGEPSASQDPLKSAAAAGELESDESASHVFNPVQMMMELLRHAMLSGFTDLNNNNKDAQAPAGAAGPETETVGQQESKRSDLEKQPSGLPVTSENKEEIVEIHGKKYLKQIVIKKHAGDGFFFMTRGINLKPLNETDSSASASASTTTVKPELIGEKEQVTTAAQSTGEPLVIPAQEASIPEAKSDSREPKPIPEPKQTEAASSTTVAPSTSS